MADKSLSQSCLVRAAVVLSSETKMPDKCGTVMRADGVAAPLANAGVRESTAPLIDKWGEGCAGNPGSASSGSIVTDNGLPTAAKTTNAAIDIVTVW